MITKSRIGLLFELTTQIQRFKLEQVKFWLRMRYRTETYARLDLVQLQDFIDFLKVQKDA